MRSAYLSKMSWYDISGAGSLRRLRLPEPEEGFTELETDDVGEERAGDPAFREDDRWEPVLDGLRFDFVTVVNSAAASERGERSPAKGQPQKRP